jgi:hypothetical protein
VLKKAQQGQALTSNQTAWIVRETAKVSKQLANAVA